MPDSELDDAIKATLFEYSQRTDKGVLFKHVVQQILFTLLLSVSAGWAAHSRARPTMPKTVRIAAQNARSIRGIAAVERLMRWKRKKTTDILRRKK